LTQFSDQEIVFPKVEEIKQKTAISKKAKDLLLNGDVLQHVRNFGEKRLPKFGGMVSEKIALSIASRMLPKIQRNSGVSVRSKLNLMLHWYPGWAKTTSIHHFIENLIPYTHTVPKADQWMWVNATDITRSRLRGSFEESKVVPPLARLADIITIGELMQLVGYGNKGREMVAWLDGAIEERKVTVGLFTAANVEDDEILKYSKDGIKIDPETKLMTYEVPAVFIACVADLGPNELRVLNPAFFSRWEILRWNPTDEELKKTYKEIWAETKKTGQCDIEALRDVYGILKQVKIGAVREPPSKWQSVIYKSIIDKAEELSKKGNLPLYQILNLRDWGNVVRTMACHALYHQWQRYSGTDFQLELSELVWEYEDVEFVLKSIDRMISSKSIPFSTTKSPNIDKAVFETIKEKGPIGSKKIAEIITKLFNCSSTTVWRALDRLVKSKKIIIASKKAHGEIVYAVKS